MNLVLILAVVLAVVSFYGAAYLLSVWHEDKRSGTDGWPLSRVLAYLAIVGTLAANWLAGLTLIRLAEVPGYRDIQIALTPLTIIVILALDLLFPVLALYLRVIRASGYMTPSERSGLAALVQEDIDLTRQGIQHAKAAYEVANSVNEKIATLTEIVGGKEDKP